MMAHGATILWRRLDIAGHEAAVLLSAEGEQVLRGVAVLGHAGRPCEMSYTIACDESWRTTRVELSGHVAGVPRSLALRRSAAGEWRVDGAVRVDLAGCADVDLGFTPATNLLPIRRLALPVGASAQVRAAWVRFPECTVEVLEQSYARTGATTYRYESGGGTFCRELTVAENGLVLEYPDFWRVEALADSGGCAINLARRS